MTRFIDRPCPIRRIGDGQRNHFFGYYNKTPWDDLGRYLLSNQVPIMTQDLDGSEVAEVGYFDLEEKDTFKVLGSTTAWNWQMGCQLQWLETPGDQQIIYNTRAMGPEITEFPYADFRANVYDCASEEVRELPLPVYAVAPDGSYALCLDYARLDVVHKTIGYPPTHRLSGFRAAHAATQPDPAPNTDGIWRMNIETGEHVLLLSLRQLYDFEHLPSMDTAIHWVTHLEIAPGGQRFLFLHRWAEPGDDEARFSHRLFTCNVDGSDLQLIESADQPLSISNPTWRDDRAVIAWSSHDGSAHYHLYNEQDGSVEAIGVGTLTGSGHMTYSMDRRFILTDTCPNAETNLQRALLYDVTTDTCYMLGEFYADPDVGKHNRCDLHPRFSPDNRFVTIDSVHEGSRQQYLLDVSELTA